MTINKDAYNRIRLAAAAAQLGFHDAATAKDGTMFLDLYTKFDDEMDRMIADELAQSAGAYKILTAGMKTAKTELDDIVGDIQSLVKTTETAIKIATIFAKLLAIL